jgi:hypothetical protein
VFGARRKIVSSQRPASPSSRPPICPRALARVSPSAGPCERARVSGRDVQRPRRSARARVRTPSWMPMFTSVERIDVPLDRQPHPRRATSTPRLWTARFEGRPMREGRRTMMRTGRVEADRRGGGSRDGSPLRAGRRGWRQDDRASLVLGEARRVPRARSATRAPGVPVLRRRRDARRDTMRKLLAATRADGRRRERLMSACRVARRRKAAGSARLGSSLTRGFGTVPLTISTVPFTQRA